MKHEKFIQEKHNAKGELFFRIYIPYKDEKGIPQKPVSENVIAKHYESPKIALTVACIKRDSYLKDIRNNTYVSSNKFPTVEELWNKKFEYLIRSKKTQQKHTTYWNKGINKLAKKRINSITTAELQKNINEFALNHSQEQISKYISSWRDLYKVCNMLDIPVVDKTQAIVMPKSKKISEPSPVTFSNEDFFKIIDLLNNYEARKASTKYLSIMAKYVLLIGYYTGMRPAEILAISASDITDKGIKVWKSIGSTSTETIAVIPTKTPQSTRYIPIHENLKPILDELISISSNEPLIAEIDGSLLNSRKISSMIKTICKKNNIVFHLYSLRHAFATNLIQSGVAPRTAQDLMGHASFSMSMEYARSSESERIEAIKKIGK